MVRRTDRPDMTIAIDLGVKHEYTTACVFCACRIRIENALKTEVIRTVFSMRILFSQSPLATDNVLNYSVTHLPVYLSKSCMRITHRKCARNMKLQYKYASAGVCSRR